MLLWAEMHLLLQSAQLLCPPPSWSTLSHSFHDMPAAESNIPSPNISPLLPELRAILHFAAYLAGRYGMWLSTSQWILITCDEDHFWSQPIKNSHARFSLSSLICHLNIYIQGNSGRHMLKMEKPHQPRFLKDWVETSPPNCCPPGIPIWDCFIRE